MTQSASDQPARQGKIAHFPGRPGKWHENEKWRRPSLRHSFVGFPLENGFFYSLNVSPQRRAPLARPLEALLGDWMVKLLYPLI